MKRKLGSSLSFGASAALGAAVYDAFKGGVNEVDIAWAMIVGVNDVDTLNDVDTQRIKDFAQAPDLDQRLRISGPLIVALIVFGRKSSGFGDLLARQPWPCDQDG